jgi:class 3 adenylate cyclase
MVSQAATSYARAGDVHIAYQVSGGGRLDLLLVPDGAIPIASVREEPSFDRFIRHLERFARVVMFDRRGTGMSDPVTPSTPPTLEQWMGDAEAVLDAAGSERAALLGFAEGGFVVTLLAASRPDRVTALALVNATPGISAEPFRAWGVAAQAHDRLAGTVDEEWGNVDWGIPLFAPSAVEDERYREWLEHSYRRAMSPAMARALFDVMFRSDIRDVLPSVRVPTLVIHRRGNRFLTREHGRYLAEHIEGARYVEVDGEDHVPYIGDQASILDELEEFLTGARAVRRGDRVLATVLFTDIVGSTERAVEVGDQRWGELLAEHHAVARRELERHGGREIDTAGDGFFAAFDGPASAVHCALAIIDAEHALGLDVRAGVHTGECEVIGDKLGGIAVHIGARIAGHASAGEVWVSSTVKDLVAGSGIGFLDRGSIALKGIPDLWHVFEVERGS